jgi:hypothetical protein
MAPATPAADEVRALLPAGGGGAAPRPDAVGARGARRWGGSTAVAAFLGGALLALALLAAGVAIAAEPGGSSPARSVGAPAPLGAGADVALLGCADGFNDALPENPRAATVLAKMPGLRAPDADAARVGRCARELVYLPVVTSNDAYRLGNAVERQGVGWLGARRLVLADEAAYTGSILFNFLLSGSEEQRAFVGCVVGAYTRPLFSST